MTVICRNCGKEVDEAEAFAVLTFGTPAYICTPSCARGITEKNAAYAERVMREFKRDRRGSTNE